MTQDLKIIMFRHLYKSDGMKLLWKQVYAVNMIRPRKGLIRDLKEDKR